MFCSNCGKEILDEIKFCPFCGVEVSKKISSEKVTNAEDVNKKNEESFYNEGVKEELIKALDVINKIEGFMEQKEEIESIRESVERQKKEMMEDLAPIQIWLFVLGIPFTIIAPMITNTHEITIVGRLVYGILFYYVPFFVIVNPLLGLITRGKKVAKAEAWYKEKIVPIDAQETELISVFERYCNTDAVTEARNIVPEEYFDSESVQFFLKMLNERRADTFKEAINLYEEYLHREDMKNMQMQQLALQGQQLAETRQLSQNVTSQMQEQSAYMKQISKNTKSTARAVKVNAFINLVEGHSHSKQLKRIEKNTR